MASEIRFTDLPPAMQKCAAEAMLGPTARGAGAVTRIIEEARANPVVAATLMRHVGPVEQAPSGDTAASISAQVGAADVAATTAPLSSEPPITEQPLPPGGGGGGGGGVPPSGGAPSTGLTPDQLAAMVDSGESLAGVPADQLNAAETALILSGAATPLIVRRLIDAHARSGTSASTALQNAAEEIGLTGDYVQRAPVGAGRLEAPVQPPATTGPRAQFVGPGPQLEGPGARGGAGTIPPPGSPVPGGVPPTPEGDPRLRGGATAIIDAPLLRTMEEAARLRGERLRRGTPMAVDPREFNPRLLHTLR